MTVRVAIASTNPVKRLATLEAVRAALRPDDVTALPVEVASGVPEQPIGDEETLRGARTRAEAARELLPDADLWVGVEGGVVVRADAPECMECMAWAVVLSTGSDGCRRGESRTATFTLPDEIADLVRAGVELGEATDRVFGEADLKRRTGTVGPLTDGVIDRVSYYAHALVLAMIPLRNEALTFPTGADAELSATP